MNRPLQYFNLAGVLTLAALCAFQWQINRRVNLEANRLEKTRLELSREIAEQEETIHGCRADLEAFREQLQSTARSLKETESRLRDAERANIQLTAERDQLKENVAKWTDAVKERDEQLAQAREQIQTLAADRNRAVVKFNELAEKYNATVADLNNRTKDFNSLVEKYNELAKASSGRGGSSN